MTASKYSLLLFLLFIGLKSKSQTLLNLSLPEINKLVASGNGGLIHKFHKKVKFGYITPPEGNDCIFFTTCYFTDKKKCYKYVNDYWGDRLPNEEINRLKEHYPDLKKIDNKPKWTDYKKGFTLTLIHDEKVQGAYSLLIENINSKDK